VNAVTTPVYSLADIDRRAVAMAAA